MKVFIGLVLGMIAVGLVITAAAGAFLFGVSETIEFGEAEDIGVTEFNAYPHPDKLAIEVNWKVAGTNATYTLQRTLDPDSDDWTDVFTLGPESDGYIDDLSAAYVDPDVEHLVTYYYRFYFTTPTGGMGYSPHMAVTAVRPSS